MATTVCFRDPLSGGECEVSVISYLPPEPQVGGRAGSDGELNLGPTATLRVTGMPEETVSLDRLLREWAEEPGVGERRAERLLLERALEAIERDRRCDATDRRVTWAEGVP